MGPVIKAYSPRIHTNASTPLTIRTSPAISTNAANAIPICRSKYTSTPISTTLSRIVGTREEKKLLHYRYWLVPPQHLLRTAM